MFSVYIYSSSRIVLDMTTNDINKAMNRVHELEHKGYIAFCE